jgi:nitroreductase
VRVILSAGSRVPDHGKLFPWWFITFQGEARASFGDVLADAWQKREPRATPEQLENERRRFQRAPLVIAVISRPRESTIPVWEQILSAGAACQTMLLACNALGFGAAWITEWYAYDDTVRAALKLDPQDHVAGFIFIGAPLTAPEERARPDLALLANDDWRKNEARGDAYAKDGLGYETKGFSLADF